jgi:putative tricarboxylic transport membrane protein
MRQRIGTDLLAGLLLASFGGVGVWLGSGYSLGTAARMGPGFFPLLVSIALLAFGLLTSVVAFVADEPLEGNWALRPLVLVLASVAVFALALRPFGLIVAIMLLVGVSALGGRGSRLVETVLLAIGLSGFAVLLFVEGLGIPVRVWPW